VLPPSRVHDARVVDTLLGEGCVVTGATLTRCVLGNGTHVGRGASLEACLLLGSDAVMDGRAWAAAVAAGTPVPGVGDRSVLRGVVVDRNGCVGPDVTLINAARVAEADRSAECGFVVADSIVVVPRGAVVPAGTVF
jgi:glucose-1-phosphate adenylyltransferase